MKSSRLLLVVLVLLLAAALWAGGNSARDTSAAGGPLPIQMTVGLYEAPPDLNNFYWKTFQEKANVKLDVTWIPESDYNAKLNLILASNDLPEVITTNRGGDNNPAYISAVSNGAFWDLTPILGDFSNYPNLKNNSAPQSFITSRVLGKNYGIPRTTSQWQGVPLVRKDLFDELGIPLPTTMKAFLDGVEAILKKYPDMIGLVSKQIIPLNDGGLAGGFGSNEPHFNNEDGLIWTQLTPAYTKYIAFMREAYARGLISKEFSAMQVTQASDYFQSGRGVVFLCESARWCYPFQTTIRERTGNQKVEVMFVPPMEGDPGKYVGGLGTGWADTFSISSKVSRNKMLQILDYFERTSIPEIYALSTYGVEGVHWTRDAEGYMVTNAQRDKDLGQSNPWQVLPGCYYAYQKIDSTAAPGSYNAKMRKIFDESLYATRNTIGPFSVVNSTLWVQAWPKFQSNWAAQATQAITGQITMEQYQNYVNSVNNDPDMRAAYKDFGTKYRAVFN